MNCQSVGLEPLECRVLFAGVTLITHGWNGRLQGFVNTAAADITARLGGPSHVAQYTMDIQPTSQGYLYIASVTHKDGTATASSADTGEIILIVDWRSVDKNSFYSAGYVASTVTDFMKNETLDGVRLAELPLHEMALSRGTALLDEVAKSLGNSGGWVDQITYLDARPIGIMGDAPPIVYDNVAFADNYWRTDGNPANVSSNGQHIDGAYNLYAQFINDHHDGYGLVHLAPAAYYNGTINFNSNDGGEGPIYDDWYGNTPQKPPRDKSGFYYSNIIGGPRPGEGVWPASGGTGVRTFTGMDGAQWPNVTDIAPTSSTINAGEPIEIHYLRQDRDSAATVTFYLDRDRNPYNNNFAATLGSTTFDAGDAVTSGVFTASSGGVGQGNYSIVAMVADAAGHSRVAYSRSIQISGPVAFDPFRPNFTADRVLRVSGTTEADSIRISRSPSRPDRLVVNVNGHMYRYDADSIPTIYVYGNDGDDSIAINEKYGAIFSNTRLMGDAGNDTIMAGSGNDSLYGGDGNDRIYGGNGRDRIDGGLGTDRTWGQGGRDYFVNWKKVELMDFRDGDVLLGLA
ncbi:hypothetical protein BH09PLA1_BH09PLA1_25450 [soil metagenome]